MFTSKSIPDTYIDGKINNPFAKILCTSRTLVATPCSGVCSNCKKDREAFFESEVRNQLALEIRNPRYGLGADQEILPDTGELEKSIRARLTAEMKRIEQKKGEAVGLISHVNERMRILLLQAASPEVATIMQY